MGYQCVVWTIKHMICIRRTMVLLVNTPHEGPVLSYCNCKVLSVFTIHSIGVGHASGSCSMHIPTLRISYPQVETKLHVETMPSVSQ